MITGRIPFSPLSLASCFFPVVTGRYWFFTIYFGMYLLSPFYNIAVKSMDKKQHFSLLSALTFLFTVLNSIHPAFKGMNSGGAWGLCWFTVLYFTASYLRLHYKPDFKKKTLLKSFSVFLLGLGSAAVLFFLSRILKIDFLIDAADNLIKYDSFPVFLSSVALFVFFLNLPSVKNDKARKFISKVSVSTFAVYLIHHHANVLDKEAWISLGMGSLLDKPWFVLYQISLVAIIFAACVVLDFIRIPLFRLLKVDKITNFFISKVKSALSKIYFSISSKKEKS